MSTALLIACKDFRLNLRSARFFIGFLLCLFFVPFVMVTGVDDYRMQCNTHCQLTARADSLLANAHVWSEVRPEIVKRPELLSIFSRGITAHIGVDNRILLGEYPFFPVTNGDAATRNNTLLNTFLRLDFMDVMGIVLSLLALVFSYDAFSREREEGTLRMIFAQPVRSSSFPVGKLLGILFTLVPVLLFCFVLAVGYLLMQPDIHFLLTDWTGIGFLLFTSSLYLLCFIFLGMFISLLARHSSTAIMVSLLCWLVFQFVFPPVVTYMAQTWVRVPLYERVVMQLQGLNREFSSKYWEIWNEEVKEKSDNPEDFAFVMNNSGDDGFAEVYGGARRMARMRMRVNARVEPLRIWYADRKWQFQLAFLEKVIQQQRLQKYLSRLSPTGIYNQAASAVCSTSSENYLEYMAEVRRYRREVIDYFRKHRIFSSLSYISTQTIEDLYTDEAFEEEIRQWVRERPVQDSIARMWMQRLNARPYLKQVSELPRFQQKRVSVKRQFKSGVGMWVLLFVLSVGLSGAIVYLFRHYDIR